MEGRAWLARQEDLLEDCILGCRMTRRACRRRLNLLSNLRATWKMSYGSDGAKSLYAVKLEACRPCPHYRDWLQSREAKLRTKLKDATKRIWARRRRFEGQQAPDRKALLGDVT